MRRFYIARIQHALHENEETAMVLNSISKEIAKSSRPKKYSPGPGNCLVEHEKSFQKMCAMMEKTYRVSPKDMTLFEFMSKIELLKEDAKSKSNGLVGEVKPS